MTRRVKYYRLDVGYDGTDRAARDARITAVLGTPGGSGGAAGWRQLEFYYDTLSELSVAIQRLADNPFSFDTELSMETFFKDGLV